MEKNNENEIISKIKSWKKIAKCELVICLHWIDFLDQRWHKAASVEDVQLICVGVGSTDPVWSKSSSRIDFYNNLHSLIKHASFCIFEGYTSAIFYTASLQIPFGIFSTDFEKRKIKSSSFFSDEHNWLKSNAEKHMKNITIDQNFSEVSMELLGLDQLQSPDALTSLLKWRTLRNILE